jgi:hypothetical protein
MLNGAYWLNKVTLGKNFEFNGTRSYLPEANNDEGKWYDISGNAYTSEEIAINHKSLMTYANIDPTATNTMILEKQEFNRSEIVEELFADLIKKLILNDVEEEIKDKIENEILKEADMVNELKDDIREELNANKEVVKEKEKGDSNREVIEEEITEEPKEEMLNDKLKDLIKGSMF